MLSNRGLLYRLYRAVHIRRVKLLWNSQKKSLKTIGMGSTVLEIPYIEGAGNIEIGNNFHCGKDVRLEAWNKYGGQHFAPLIKIGNGVTFTDRCYLSCIDRIEIGDGVLLGRDVFIADNSHGDTSMIDIEPLSRPLTSKGPVRVGKNVWLGRHVTVLSGVTIGDNSIIGAHSLVNKDIPANCLAAGNPAKVIKLLKQ